jgi:chromosome partitioning protein
MKWLKKRKHKDTEGETMLPTTVPEVSAIARRALEYIEYLETRVMPDKSLVLSFQNQKGGVGKTTLALHIAHCFVTIPQTFGHHRRVLVLDADPQGSCRDWAAARKEECPFTVVGYDRPTIHKDIAKIASGYHYVIIDAPPRVTDIARSAILASDAVIIPIQPSPYDIWAVQETFRLIEEAKQYKERLKYAIAINRKIVNTGISRDVDTELRKAGLTVFEDPVSQRVAFAECAVEGKTIFETCDRYHPAVREVNQLFVDIISWLKLVSSTSIQNDGLAVDEKDLYPVREYD